jgi:hypothetical protein
MAIKEKEVKLFAKLFKKKVTCFHSPNFLRAWDEVEQVTTPNFSKNTPN